MLTLYDAPRCPYCARARIALAEKGLEYEVMEVDLSDRPQWIYEKNPTGRVLKYQLRDEGCTPTTWDREEAGIIVRRRK